MPLDPVPVPFGWCSWCLALPGRQQRQAETLMDGFALCRKCNAAAHEHMGDQWSAAKRERLRRMKEAAAALRSLDLSRPD
ncbi:hypothetical protein [Blastococcus sp. SYSU D01042]